MLNRAVDVTVRTGFGDLPWIGADELLRLVDMNEAITVVDEAMRVLSAGSVAAPERWAMPVADHGRMGLMPGAAPSLSRFGVKVLGLFDADARGALPSHQGVMLLFDLADGRPLCAVDGAALTTLRTAAASAVASRALARPGARTLAIIGCGDQAPLHLEALRAVFPIREVTLWNRTAKKADAFARRYLSGLAWRVCSTPAQAAAGADIVCTLTAATDPILSGKDFQPGQHVNLVGSSTVGPREVDDAFVAKVRYIVDSREHALSQAAEFVHAVGDGIVSQDHLVGEIGDVLTGAVAGRTRPDDITAYKSLGHIIQDLAVADAAFRKIAGPARNGRSNAR
ncbi:ornithine cyclodeaminase family protein [Sphingopyxis sp. J-6]|uniref:ornithine cyclodeaminase family protein n=1 Tax=Sphingopyxis sp. J-6 TaxID=3122054 RepID=UPI003983E70A